MRQVQTALRLPEELLNRAAILVGELSSDDALRAATGKLTRSAILRIAIERGLRALEAEQAEQAGLAGQAERVEPRSKPNSSMKRGAERPRKANSCIAEIDPVETELEVLDRLQKLFRSSGFQYPIRYVKYHEDARFFAVDGARFSRWFIKLRCDGRLFRLTCRLTPATVRRLVAPRSVEVHGNLSSVRFGEPRELAQVDDLLLLAYEYEARLLKAEANSGNRL